MRTVQLGLLGVAIMLTLPACSKPSNITGVMVYGHEVRTVRLCNQTQVHWLEASLEVQKQLKEISSQLTQQPYQELYLDFTGEYTAESKGEFAKSYDGAMIVHKVHSLSREIPVNCN